jgi:ADP-ribose pyrophosphatase
LAKSEYPEVPRVAVGGVVIREDRVLLVLRGNPPADGQWSIPGGRVRLGESLQKAVERELREETGVVVRGGDPVYVFDSVVKDADGKVRFHYVIVDLQAEYVAGEPTPGDDAREARWVRAEELEPLNVNRKTVGLLAKLGFLDE